MSHPRLWAWCGLVLLLLAAGCTEPQEGALPEELNDMDKWGEVSFDGTIGEVYADHPAATTEYIQVYLYFPFYTPSNPNSGSVRMHLRLEEAFEELPGSHLIDSTTVFGAPATPILDFNRTNLLYSGYMAPYAPGQWTLEFTWVGANSDIRTYIPIIISDVSTRQAVVAVANNIQELMVVLAWLEPPQPVAGTQTYELLAWRARDNTTRFDLDSTFTVQLAFPEEDPPGEEPPDSSVAIWENGHYTGTLSFPSSSSWEVNATVVLDTVDVGSAVFQLD